MVSFKIKKLGKVILLARQTMDSWSHTNIDILFSDSTSLLQKIESVNPMKKCNQGIKLGQVPKGRVEGTFIRPNS